MVVRGPWTTSIVGPDQPRQGACYLRGVSACAVGRRGPGWTHSRRFDGRLSARSRNGVHISDHRLAPLIHMHMLDPDDLRVAVPEAP